MSGVGPKQSELVASLMPDDDRQLWTGVALLLIAGVLLFGPIAVGAAFSHELSAIAVLGLAAGAALVGTAGEERPV